MISLGQYSCYLRRGGAVGALIGVPLLAGLTLGKAEEAWVIMAVTFISLLVLLLIFWICLRFWKAKKGLALSRMLSKNAASVDISGIESLRSNFEEGVEKLRKANKNVYDLPWFLLAGQAGAGKTEAIRRSHAKEDFPAGLNDMMQGVGGTLNMNWWFTNKGIVLDTAGRIFEERGKPGQGTEWQEFLKLLKKARKNMPINGFILAIPADSLIRDGQSVIEEKASHIAEQITLVQNMLGVRFPVFIIVTKADFIPGFREFVENVNDPRLQQQMLGWSNPRGLDEPFMPEQVDSYLDGVVQKLKKRRLTYMLDPRPSGKKRLDDLDALFTFPKHLRDAIPNLRRYIEIVFSLNPWSDKPLFIRGIYFTSSLQQGEALDAALAEVMGKNLNEMALSSFMKETPLFLRDAFFEKIYRESGLVTSARRVKGAMRRRLMLFSVTCLLGVALILAAAFFGSRSFRDGVGDQYAHWKFAAKHYETSSGSPSGRDMTVVYNTLGDNFESDRARNFKVGQETYNLSTYLLQLAEFTSDDLDVPGVFKPLKFFDDVLTGDSLNREEAFRIVYQDAIILPILENSREKMRGTATEGWDENALNGLRAQIRMQLLLNQQEREPGFSDAFWRELDALFNYLTQDNLGTELKKSYELFFADNYVAESGWPSEKSAAVYAATDGVDIDNGRSAAIARGLDLWMNQLESVREQKEDQVAELSGLLRELEEVGRFESASLAQAVESGNFGADQFNVLDAKVKELDGRMSRLSGSDSGFLFESFYQAQIESAKARVVKRVEAVSSEINAIGGEESVFGNLIQSRIANKRKALIDSFDEIADPALLARFRQADERFIATKDGIKARLVAYRAYRKQINEMLSIHFDSWREFRASLDQSKLLRDRAVESLHGFDGYLSEDFARLREQANTQYYDVEGKLVGHYRSLVRQVVSPYLGFPVIADSPRDLSLQEVTSFGTLLPELVTYSLSLEQKLQPDHAELIASDLKTLRRISNFVLLELIPIIEEGRLKVVFPSVDRLLQGKRDLASLRKSILWRARFVHLDDFGEPKRIGKKPLELGEVSLKSEGFVLIFTSTLVGRSGDSGEVMYSGVWAPIRLLFNRSVDRIDSGNGSFKIEAQVLGGPADGLNYSVDLKFSPLPPSLDAWLRQSDLKGFQL